MSGETATRCPGWRWAVRDVDRLGVGRLDVDQLEHKIDEWRQFVARRPGVDDHDSAELEAHLRDQIADLAGAGLSPDEAFLIAVQRIGSLDEMSREYAREHTGRLWKQLVVSDIEHPDRPNRRLVDALALAVMSAAAVTVARVAAGFPGEESAWLFRNASLLVLPFLAGYFAMGRRLTAPQWSLMAAPVAIAAVLVNLYPFADDAQTEVLAAGHLPIVLWFVVAYAYVNGVVGSHERRMDVVRFTGEWLVYYALIALGGGVLMGLSAAILEPAGVDSERIIEWVVPMGAAGAVIVAAWLVDAKQHVVENMAPVLTMVFTPLFAIMLIVATLVYAFTALGGDFDRELVAVFDVLMVVVLGLVLYGMSAREPSRRAGWMDRIQLVAVVSALLLDLFVLGAMLARVEELGFTPNRAAALGLNLLLLVNLAGTAWWSVRFLTGRSPYHRLERWQTAYLPFFGAWAATVVVVFPVVFDFV